MARSADSQAGQLSDSTVDKIWEAFGPTDGAQDGALESEPGELEAGGGDEQNPEEVEGEEGVEGEDGSTEPEGGADEEGGEGEEEEGDALAAAEWADDPLLKPFIEEDQLDLEKLTKSYREAQAMIGKTAEDRGKIKKLESFETAIYDLYQKDPAFKKAYDRAAGRAAGTLPAETETVEPEAAAEPEVTDDQITALIEQGKIAEAIKLGGSAGSRKEVAALKKQLKQLKLEREEAERARQQQAAASARDAEWQAFADKHKLVDASGTWHDSELYKAMSDVNSTYPSMKYEDMRLMALSRLGRSDKQKPRSPEKKKRMVAIPKGGRSVRRKRHQRDAFNLGPDDFKGLKGLG